MFLYFFNRMGTNSCLLFLFNLKLISHFYYVFIFKTQGKKKHYQSSLFFTLFQKLLEK